ncbi:MAG: hypothetical protein ABW042_02015 [Phenylobacterium sp.]
MRHSISIALFAAALAGPAHAQAWAVRALDGACETQAPLAARRGGGLLTLHYDGDVMRMSFPAPAGATLRGLYVDRKRFTPQVEPAAGGTASVTVDPALQATMARGRVLRLAWRKAPTAQARLDGAAAGLAALKDCAEPFRIARLPRLEADEADSVGVYDSQTDLLRQSAIAQARDLYQQERLEALAAGRLLPGEKRYPFEGQAPVVCTPGLDDFVCR